MKEYFPGYAEKAERRKLRSLTGIVLAVIAGLVIAGVATCANADEVFQAKDRDGEATTMRIKEEPCTNPAVLGHLHDRLLDDRRFKAALLTWKGKDWQSCWAEKDGLVISIDEEDVPFQAVPRSAFKEESV